MGFVRFFINPVDCLVGTGELADATELPTVEVPEPAVCAPFRTVEFGHDDATAVGPLALPEDLIRADLCTEVAALAPVSSMASFMGNWVLSY